MERTREWCPSVFPYIFDDHHKKWQLYAKCFLWVCRAGNVVCAHIASNDFQNAALNVVVCQPLDMPIAHLLVPNLKRTAPERKKIAKKCETPQNTPDRIEDRQETRLECVTEHGNAGERAKTSEISSGFGAIVQCLTTTVQTGELKTCAFEKGRLGVRIPGRGWSGSQGPKRSSKQFRRVVEKAAHSE